MVTSIFSILGDAFVDGGLPADREISFLLGGYLADVGEPGMWAAGLGVSVACDRNLHSQSSMRRSNCIGVALRN
jgi:hypothetical protein